MSEKEQADKKPFFKQVWFWAIVAVVVIGIGVAVGGNSGPKKVGETSGSNSSESTTEKTDFKVGDIISTNGMEIAVKSVERNYQPENEYIKVKDGKEYVKVNISIENKGDSTASYNTLDFKIEDSNGAIEDYMSAAMASASDALNSGELASGGKKTGSIVFEVPKDDQNLKLHFKKAFTNEKDIIIVL